MINLNELMEIADSRAVCVRVPVTRRLSALIHADPRDVGQLDDLTRLYGEMPVYSFKPNELTGALDIDLAVPETADRGAGA